MKKISWALFFISFFAVGNVEAASKDYVKAVMMREQILAKHEERPIKICTFKPGEYGHGIGGAGCFIDLGGDYFMDQFGGGVNSKTGLGSCIDAFMDQLSVTEAVAKKFCEFTEVHWWWTLAEYRKLKNMPEWMVLERQYGEKTYRVRTPDSELDMLDALCLGKISVTDLRCMLEHRRKEYNAKKKLRYSVEYRIEKNEYDERMIAEYCGGRGWQSLKNNKKEVRCMTMKKAKYALEPKEDEESGGVGNVPDAAMKAGFKRARAVAEAIKAKYKDFATRCKQYGGNGCLTDVGNGYYWDPKHDTFAYFGNALVESKR